MNQMFLFKAALAVVFTASIVFTVQAADRDDLADIRAATSQFQTTPSARAAGYNMSASLDYCLQNREVGGLGYRYINSDLLDTTVDALRPEVLVYSPDRNGSIQLSAVEYLVPAAAWDVQHTQPPQILDQSFHFNETLGMYVFHVWIWKHNPSGIFEDWNPDVTCPATLPWHGPGPSR